MRLHRLATVIIAIIASVLVLAFSAYALSAQSPQINVPNPFLVKCELVEDVSVAPDQIADYCVSLTYSGTAHIHGLRVEIRSDEKPMFMFLGSKGVEMSYVDERTANAAQIPTMIQGESAAFFIQITQENLGHAALHAELNGQVWVLPLN